MSMAVNDHSYSLPCMIPQLCQKTLQVCCCAIATAAVPHLNDLFHVQVAQASSRVLPASCLVAAAMNLPLW